MTLKSALKYLPYVVIVGYLLAIAMVLFAVAYYGRCERIENDSHTIDLGYFKWEDSTKAFDSIARTATRIIEEKKDELKECN